MLPEQLPYTERNLCLAYQTQHPMSDERLKNVHLRWVNSSANHGKETLMWVFNVLGAEKMVFEIGRGRGAIRVARGWHKRLRMLLVVASQQSLSLVQSAGTKYRTCHTVTVLVTSLRGGRP